MCTVTEVYNGVLKLIMTNYNVSYKILHGGQEDPYQYIKLDINALYNLTGKCMLEDQRIPEGGKGGVFGG